MQIKIVFLMLTLFAISATIGASALSCTENYECLPVSQDYNFVECLDNVCVCKTDSGFVGDAKVTSMCDCPSPRIVRWDTGEPFCLSYDESVACTNRQAKEDHQKDVVYEMYNAMIWPSGKYIIQNYTQGETSYMATIFAQNGYGRVDPVGTYEGFDGLIEYFYVTMDDPNYHPVNVHFESLMSQEDRVSVRVKIEFVAIVQGFSAYFNITQSGYFIFNDDALIEQAYLNIHNMGKLFDQQTPPGAQTWATVCYLVVNLAGCTETEDPDGYYTDFDDCLYFMAGLEHGTWHEVPSDTVVCRYYHATLARLKPDVHCSHSGKTGGGKCITTAYEDLQTYLDYQPY